MKISLLLWLLIVPLTSLYPQAEPALLKGIIHSQEVPVAFASIYSADRRFGTQADQQGNYVLELPEGDHRLVVRSQGYRIRNVEVEVTAGETLRRDFELVEDVLNLDGVVVSATRNRVDRFAAPVVVSTIQPRLFQATQSLTLAEGIGFAPGVRMENNCQNCGFTQVRLNGLEGGYTQILINSRPLFSSLLGVYGLEQVPANIIERVEVVRGGGSALYGSNAIAGTVNVITRDPVQDAWEVQTNWAAIDRHSLDRQVGANAQVVADDLRSGSTFFGTYRKRDAYDANADGFTEVVTLRNQTIGAKSFWEPDDDSRLGINFTAIQEYRRGGDRLDLAPFLTDITEELQHDTFMGGLEYERRHARGNGQWEAYVSAVHTGRSSYYGGLGGGRTAQDSLLAINAFGSTQDYSWVTGLKQSFVLAKRDQLTWGLEYTLNQTEDQIPGYHRGIDQRVSTTAGYAQYEWRPSERFTALAGGRVDRVDVRGVYTLGALLREQDTDRTVLSPRVSLSWKWTDRLKLRAGYARGFRAVQAFNEDLHIASVGGEPQFTLLAEDLEPEFSDAWSGSLNYSVSRELMQLDLLLEGFHTRLDNPFTTVNTGVQLDNGSILNEVRNGVGARVYGTNFELGYSPRPAWVMQLGGTIQAARYDTAQLLFESSGDPAEPDVTITDFARMPNWYGYLNASWVPSEDFNLDLSGSFTGPMDIPRVVSESGFVELNRSPVFADMNIRAEVHWDLSESLMVTLSGGVRNLWNSYQRDFDTGPQRDSNYIYGPGLPRSVFVGLRFGRLH